MTLWFNVYRSPDTEGMPFEWSTGAQPNRYDAECRATQHLNMEDEYLGTFPLEVPDRKPVDDKEGA